MGAFKYSSALVFICIGLLVSCVKDPQDIPGSSNEDEIFGIQGTFGNETVSLGAGVNQWTNLPATVQGDSIDAYTSLFSLNGCLDQCAPSWRFDFYQALPGLDDPAADFQQTIQVGKKEFVSSTEERKTYDILLSTHPGLFMSGYSFWADLNGNPSSFFHEYQSIAEYGDTVNVCFQSFAYTGCMYKQCVSFNPVTEIPCLVRLDARLENPRYLQLSVKPEGTAPFSVLWSNGSTSWNRVIPLQDSISEVYADVMVTDALGNRSVLSQTIRIQNPAVDACYFPIELTSNPHINENPEAFENRLVIIYVDEAGHTWSSLGKAQPQTSELTIDAIHYYGPSPASEVAYVVDVTADVLLTNEVTGESRTFRTERLSLALSHR